MAADLHRIAARQAVAPLRRRLNPSGRRPPSVRVAQRRSDRPRAIFGIDMLIAGRQGALPANVVSQSLTTQTLIISAHCTMTVKLWGGGGGRFDPFNTSTSGRGGGYATAVFSLSPGDVVTYAAGGPGRAAVGAGSPSPGSSGSGTRNGGNCDGVAGPGGGCTELYINGVPVLLAGGGGGGCDQAPGGGGGGTNGQAGGNTNLATGGGGGTQSSPGAGGQPGAVIGSSGQAGSGGTGGAGGSSGGGGGGGGRFGGGGGAGRGSNPSGEPTGGGGGSGYDSTGAGTLTAATSWQAANSSDPDRPSAAGDAENAGAVVLTFAA